ncbi:sulfur carrier protein ThiS [Pedobacter alpinus]|uniref:Sulfur carrier protein ThiS n=1 Tax=Pedobacter alpinus TaxID=1590643 RepID=A0ABW5TRP8_9SPHI
MEITVNQQVYQITHNCNIKQLFGDVLQKPSQGLAIAINQNIIPKTQWESHFLQSGDKIIIIKATQGG